MRLHVDHAVLVSLLVSLSSPLATAAHDPGQHSLKGTFVYNVEHLLRQTQGVKCQGIEKSAAWSEYCDSVGTVVPCPSPGTEPSAAFYSSHCILYLILLKVNEWQDGVFYEVSTLLTAWNELYASLPPERCGHSEADYCDRTRTICHRSPNIEGICRPVDEVCGQPHHKWLCDSTAQAFLLREQVLEILGESPPENIDVDPAAGAGAGAAPTESAEAGETPSPGGDAAGSPRGGASSANLASWLIVTIGFGLGGAILLARYLRRQKNRDNLCRRWRRLKAATGMMSMRTRMSSGFDGDHEFERIPSEDDVELLTPEGNRDVPNADDLLHDDARPSSWITSMLRVHSSCPQKRTAIPIACRPRGSADVTVSESMQAFLQAAAKPAA